MKQNLNLVSLINKKDIVKTLFEEKLQAVL